nr:MAG TPA: hypothetical protein [Caudoviricetes sp.]DAK23251.1 MAG TPA: hypothetical protein [Caudoviricetes sp.]
MLYLLIQIAISITPFMLVVYSLIILYRPA